MILVSSVFCSWWRLDVPPQLTVARQPAVLRLAQMKYQYFVLAEYCKQPENVMLPQLAVARQPGPACCLKNALLSY